MPTPLHFTPRTARPVVVDAARRAAETDYKWLEIQLADMFPRLSPELQRAYVALMQFQVGEPADVAALERVASEDALWTLTDVVQSVINEIYEMFPHVGKDDDDATDGAR